MVKQSEYAHSTLEFHYPQKVDNCTIMNNGHTVQVNIPGDAKCQLVYKGKPFTLRQFHFHTPSEHTLDSKQYEMEMHLVHTNDNDFLAQFWSQLPSKKTSQDIPLKKDISFDYLFETCSNEFIKDVERKAINIDMEIFEYNGSLTTPPYTEGVQWLVSKTTHFINNKQLHKLSACWGHENNARPCQGYFGRCVSLRNQSSMIVCGNHGH